MSYDLMIFEPKAAPKSLNEFMYWNKIQQLDIGSQLEFYDTKMTTPNLKKWFKEVVKSFIPLSGPFSNEDDEDYEEGQDDEIGAEYFIGKNVIYVMFSMEDCEGATNKMLEIAKKCKVGFCDFNTSADYIYYP